VKLTREDNRGRESEEKRWSLRRKRRRRKHLRRAEGSTSTLLKFTIYFNASSCNWANAVEGRSLANSTI